jgi:hypothetical protein
MSDVDQLRRALKLFAPCASTTAAAIDLLRVAGREFGCAEIGRAAAALAIQGAITARALAVIETVRERQARERAELLAAYDARGGDGKRGAAMAVARKLSSDPATRKSIERRIFRARDERISVTVGK